eukprot:TRINITY_DN2194_c0_g1_i1.p1 TRINITY_DN2194_c0_g1~~TRINITY_DN2194_c0_g1_i1.p1  ORF type:complete len:745 (+),score=122.50 TRINITY_DN2194_c0_g1_i1:67-2235(+)
MEGHTLIPWQNGAMLCYGGKRSDKYTSDLWVVTMKDDAKVSWEHVRTGEGQVPRPRAYHTANLWRGKFMLVVGGVGEVEKGGVEDHFWMYDDASGWRVQECHGDAPARRCHHTVSVAPSSDVLYLYGGYPVGPNAEELFRVHPGTSVPVHREFFEVYQLNLMGSTPMWRRTTATNSPPMLWGHTSTLFASNLIVFGGVDVVDSKESHNICVWHTDRHEWRWVDFNSGPTPRALHSAAEDAGAGKMYIFGGFGNVNTMRYNDTWSFSAEAGQWTPLRTTGPLTVTARSGNAMCLLPGKRLFIHGGIDSDGNVISDAQVLDINTGIWTSVASTRVEPPKLPVPSPSTPPPAAGPLKSPIREPSAQPIRSVIMRFEQPSSLPAVSRTIGMFMNLSPSSVHVSSIGSNIARVTITGVPTANELSEELLRRCLHPQDPLRSALRVIAAAWEGEQLPMPEQMSHYPLKVDQMVPFSDDRRLVQTYHEELPEVDVIVPPSPAAHPEPAKFGMSQGCQTRPVQEPAGDGGGENIIIQKQKEEIEELRKRLASVERPAAPNSITGYLRFDDYEVPMLSSSTPRGPELTLTKMTLADLLPETVRSRQMTGISQNLPKISKAAAVHVNRSSAALTMERRAAEYLDASILDPSQLPTAHTDPTFPAPPHGKHPAYPHTGNAPIPLRGTGPSVPSSIPAAPPRMPPSRRVPTSVPTLKDIISGKATMLSITHSGK